MEQDRLALGWPTLDAMSQLQLPDPPLTHESVLLRPWRQAGVPQNLMAFTDPVVQRFSWPQAARFTEQDARGYFVAQELARLRGQEAQFALVESREPDKVLGGVSLYCLNREQATAMVGYWLGPQARGGVGVHDAGAGSDRADVCTRQRRLCAGRGTLRVCP